MEAQLANQRITFMKIPVDILEDNDLENRILKMLENGKSNQIVFLSFFDFFKGRRNKDFRRLLEDAALVLPTSSLLTGGIKFLFGPNTSPYINYDFILRLLSILERNKKSIYIIGSTRKNIITSEKNLRDSYPGLQLVGRSSSFFKKDSEQDITLAMKKSSPALILAGSGLKEQNKWLYKNREKFNPGITLWNPDCFEIFSGKKKRPSRNVSGRFFSRLGKSIFKPWRIFLLFPFLYYYLLLFIYKIFKLK